MVGGGPGSGQRAGRGARGWPASIAAAAAALVVLTLVWMFAVEAWRVRWPAMLIAFVAVGLPLVVAAWRPVVPFGWRWTLGIAALMVWIDLLIDWLLENPTDHELASPEWEAGKIAAVVVASFIAARLPPGVFRRRAAAALVALSSACAVLFTALVLFVAIAGPRDQAGRADAALVLGYALTVDGKPLPNLVARVERAAELYRAGLVPRLVVSGGAARNRVTEAGAMRELLMARGVPTEAIAIDLRARSTEENFACSVPILAELGARRVLVVTEPWHMPRALYQASRYQRDLELLAVPASRSPGWQEPRERTRHLISEAVAYLFERVRRIGGSPVSCPQF